jgi:hypothetical protein
MQTIAVDRGTIMTLGQIAGQAVIDSNPWNPL